MDEKQRIALPKRIRDDLAAEKNEPLYLTPHTDESLALYTEESLKSLAQRMAAAPTRPDVRAFNRLFYAQAERLELDDQGRFRVPVNLAKHAALEREVVLVGVNDHMELWDKTRWEAYLSGNSPEYDRLAEQAFNDRPQS